MSWKVKISKQAREDLDFFRAYRNDIYHECYRMTKALKLEPYSGPGKPTNAPILGNNVWYRRSSLEDRMVYEIFEGLVVVASYRLHIE